MFERSYSSIVQTTVSYEVFQSYDANLFVSTDIY